MSEKNIKNEINFFLQTKQKGGLKRSNLERLNSAGTGFGTLNLLLLPLLLPLLQGQSQGGRGGGRGRKEFEWERGWGGRIGDRGLRVFV